MAQQYGTVKVDVLTYTSGVAGSETDVSVNVSGLVNNPTFSGDVNISGNLTVDDNVSVSGNLDVSGLATFSGITVTGNANVSGLATFSGITVTGNANVSGLGTFSGITVTGDSTLSGNVNVSGLLTASGLHVTGLISGDTDGGVYGSGYWKVPAGTTAERPGDAVTGMIRYNEDLTQFEGWDGSWNLLGGGATGSGGDRVFVLNETGVTTDYTLTGFNASSAGPITIEDGVEVIIADPFNWAIV